MIRRYVVLGAAAAAVTLSSCGGGGSSSSTPTPTSSPTPTPTPSPTYTAFPLTAAAQFSALDATTSYTGDPTAGAVTLGLVGTEIQTGRVKLAAVASLANDTAVIDESTEESRFTNANLATTASSSVTEYVYKSTSSTGSAGNFAQLEFLNNTIASQVTSDSVFSTLGTVTYANWWRGDSTTGAKRLTYSVWGYPTATNDVPTTGTASYTTRVVGRAISVANNATTITRLAGSSTTTVNFATGLVTVTLNLTTTPSAGGAETPYLTLTAQGAIQIGANQFSGSFTSGNPVSGTISGGFFGSQGVNIGIAFGASGTINGADTRIVGEVVGKKQ